MRTVLAAIAVLSAATLVSAQSGGLVVKVVDPAGDALPGAAVTITHPIGYVKEATVISDGAGLARFPVLRPTGRSGVGYKLNVAMGGFASIQIPDVKVRVGETTTVPVQLSQTFMERVEVTGTTEVVDLDDSTQTTKFSDEFIQDLPVPGRFYQNVLTLAPGVQDADGDGNPNVHGSRDRDFKTEVSGIANVDPLTGQRMSQVNPNSIEEMEVITAGAGVEFSRAQGGFARILQKQGSNQFEGLAEFYFRSSLFDGDGAGDSDNVTDPQFDWVQPGFQFSGPIIKDRLWYRLSHEWIFRELPNNTTNGIVVVTNDEQIHSDQITWQVSPRNKLALQYQSDPQTVENYGVSSALPEESSLVYGKESKIYALTWTAPYSPKILVQTQVAWQDLNVQVSPTQRNVANNCVISAEFDFLERAYCFNNEVGEWSGTYFQDWDDHRQRLTASGDATIYGGYFWGASHEFKVGVSLENERYTRELSRRSRIDFSLLSTNDNTSTEGNNPERRALINGTFSAPESTDITARGVTWGIYGQDQFKPTANLTVTLGLRIDREEMRSDGREPFDPEAESDRYIAAVKRGANIYIAAHRTFTAYESQVDFFHILAETLDIPFHELWLKQSPMVVEAEFWARTRRADSIDLSNTNPAPRLALAWDPWSNGKTKIAATAGRYYNNLFLNIPLIELEPASTDLTFEAEQFAGSWNVLSLKNSVNPAVNTRVVDRDLRTPYQDEFTLAVEREIAPETAIKLSYIKRKYRDQLQDIDLNHVPADWGRCVRPSFTQSDRVVAEVTVGDPDYDPALAPGDGILDDCMGEIDVPPGQDSNVFLHRPDGSADLYQQNPAWGDIYLVGNFNTIDYDAFVVELVRRQYRSWELQSSYTWSQAFGDGEDFGQSLGDDRSLVRDEHGFQAYDQRHVVKVNATTVTPWNFRLGGAISWQSGLPFSVLARKPAFDAVPPIYQNLGAAGTIRTRTTYPSGQRNDQRNESYWNFDVKLTREFFIGRDLNMQLTLEVFNLLNDNTYQVYDPLTENGQQINGNNIGLRRFGRQWQIGLRLAF